MQNSLSGRNCFAVRLSDIRERNAFDGPGRLSGRFRGDSCTAFDSSFA